MKGSVGISVKLLSIRDGHVDVLFQVRDTGTGISEDKFDTIFSPYTQENESIVSKHDGFGLGLSIVDTIVKTIGGNIEVESEIGKGTTFKINLKFLIPSENVDVKNPKVKVKVDF